MLCDGLLRVASCDKGIRFGVFKKYSHKRLFIGRLPVLHILLYELAGYMSYLGGHDFSIIEKE